MFALFWVVTGRVSQEFVRAAAKGRAGALGPGCLPHFHANRKKTVARQVLKPGKAGVD